MTYPYLGSMPDMGAVEHEPILIGDTNGDGKITSSDILLLVDYVFKSGDEPSSSTGDTNCDGTVTSADVIALVNYVFKGGLAPCVE